MAGFWKKHRIDVEGVSRKFDRRNAFRIRRMKNDHGLQVYVLENTAESRKIYIPRFIFGRFRACVRQILNEQQRGGVPKSLELAVDFLNRDYFFFLSSGADIENVVIQDVEEREGSSGYLTVSRRALRALDGLLYDEALQHPNDVLGEIISYHRLFQFSFVKGSKSITSGLTLRKDILQSTKRYLPRLAERVTIDQAAAEGRAGASMPDISSAQLAAAGGATRYEPKLGERFSEKDIRVDYDEIFGDSRVPSRAANDEEEAADKPRRSRKPLGEFPVPLDGAEVKALGDGSFYFELGVDQASEFREQFIGDRACDFYLGFEIIDALFRQGGAVRTFQFPLYFCRVDIRESGRGVHLKIRRDGQCWLNHLALAQLVGKFSPSSASADHVDEFFQALLAQDISIDRLNDRIRMHRHLPVAEAIFDRTREILLGYQDENGKGGLLGGLNVKGIECDLQSVVLYRAPKRQSPIEQALEGDLDTIARVAHESPGRFYSSLLGRFLTPELSVNNPERPPFAPGAWMPGAAPPSTRRLLDQLNRHELVLLEGPPGTGKTFAIRNLLLHCICRRQRVLIVSDQQAAIEALVEKIAEYLVGTDTAEAQVKAWSDLLKGALKVVDRVEEDQPSLGGLVSSIEDLLSVPESLDVSSQDQEPIERRVRAIDGKIEKIKSRLADKMSAHMGDQVPFDFRVQRKDDSRIDLDSLVEFLRLLKDDKAETRAVVDAFVANRFALVANGLEDCYGFFKLPERVRPGDIDSLGKDHQLLLAILEAGPKSLPELRTLTDSHPRHELVRHLEDLMKERVPPEAEGLRRLAFRLRALFVSPLSRRTRLLAGVVRDQAELLARLEGASKGLWDLLRELHEAIRIGENPNRALSLYRSVGGHAGSGAASDRRRGASVQGDLEAIDDLYGQRDELIKSQVVGNLKQIVANATRSRGRAGTSAATRIMALADALKQHKSLEEGASTFEEFRHELFDAFPIWVVRKQAVPFLLPCIERSFDLVIVDEATQCRVDDALPLMFRADRMLVVGDDKQTVLQKRSVIDDYLFRDHELDEHLRETQARGFKGGGSHIFALVKAIKQGSVMLDEHYRCPADIIEFSNRYVYENGLNVMQWRLPEHPPAVVVDYSEKRRRSSKKAASGKFKGIETQMVDRFFDFVAAKIDEIEEQTGRPINVETDAALCYFLLKNEPYVKAQKDKFLRALGRGEDILDGAGAALQGKERDYIFYLWDVTRYNMRSFRQGDEADQRKGELNVLMSRPKKKAFHFLHREFEDLEHGRSNITDFLWRAYGASRNPLHETVTEQGAFESTLLGRLLDLTIGDSDDRSLSNLRRAMKRRRLTFRENIKVGDARRVVDLIGFKKGRSDRVVGLVDLSAFGAAEDVDQAIVDYFFQLKRVSPTVDPVFVFPHELVDPHCPAFRSATERLERALD